MTPARKPCAWAAAAAPIIGSAKTRGIHSRSRPVVSSGRCWTPFTNRSTTPTTNMPQTKPPASEPAVRRHQTPMVSVPSMIMWMIRMPLARANGSANATTNPIEIVYA